MFKSYYVVWKPSEKEKIAIVDEMFKSYYVVWKLKKSNIKKTKSIPV